MTTFTGFTGFTPAATTFLRDLARHNQRPWFEERRDIYERELREPLRALIEEMDVRLATAAPELVGDPKRSPFRIHRDVRFSKDKSPYKTNVGFWLAHRDVGRAASEIHGGAGFYFHLEPRESFIAVGIWMPAPPALARIRAAIVDDLAAFKKTLTKLRRSFKPLSQEAVLRRPPRGYADTHPAAEWLRYKSFTASRPLLVRDVRSAGLPDLLMRHYADAIPFVRWLNHSLGLRAATRR
jgi:uncharacterized protein (TIGR02453 family)